MISLVIYTEAVVYFSSTINEDRVVGNIVDSDSMGQCIFDIVNYVAVLLIFEVYFLLFLFWLINRYSKFHFQLSVWNYFFIALFYPAMYFYL